MNVTDYYYSQIFPVAAGATSTAAGYSPNNVLNTSVLRPWRSVTTTGEYIAIDLGSVINIVAVALQACNFSAAHLNKDGFAFLAASTPVNEDGKGRRKNLFEVPGTSTRNIYIAPDGTPVDGSSYYSIGAVYIFGAKRTMPRAPLYGGAEVTYGCPQSSIDLDNGKTVMDFTGPTFANVTLPFSGGAGDDMEQLSADAQSGIVWITLGSNGLQWPMRSYESKITRRLQAFNREQVQSVLKEEV